MSRVVLAVGASHSTLMNTHWDEVSDSPAANGFRDALGDARQRIEAARPDVLVVIGSNHFRGFYLDLMPTFTIGVRDCIGSGEAGTPAGPLAVAQDLAQHLAESVVRDEFDVAFSLRLQVDHGITHALQYLSPPEVPIVPIVVNVFAPPLPSLARCDAFGRALGRALATDGTDRRVVVVGSGGLSHRLPWPKWTGPESDDDEFLVHAWSDGRENWKEYEVRRRQIVRAAPSVINPDFDRSVLELVTAGQLYRLAEHSEESLDQVGGNGAQELRTWLTASACAGHRHGEVLGYWPVEEWLTGMAVAVLAPPEQ